MPRLTAIGLTLAMLSCSPTAVPSTAATATSGSTPSATLSPTAAATARPAARLGVLVARSRPDVPYRVLLVDASGRIVASASAPVPTIGAENLPLVSTSASRVYYLDGDDTIRSLDASGRTELVRTLAGGSSTRTVFAVSPDDSLIALTTFHYSTPPPGTLAGVAVTYDGVRVEPLRGGAATQLRPAIQDLRFDAAAFPVGWLDEGLLLGVGLPYVQNMGYLTPTSAQSYEVVDPATGARRAGIAPQDCVLTGPAVRAGTACMPIAGAVLARYDWRGFKAAEFRSQRQLEAPAALSPSGARIAVASAPAGQLVLVTSPSESVTTIAGRPIGWLDDEHLVFAEADQSAGSVAIFDVVTGAVARVTERIPPWGIAAFFATLPNDLR